MIAEFANIEQIPYSRAKSDNQIFDFLVGKHFVQAGAFNVQDFAAQRQNGLESAVAALLGAATGGISLNNIELAFGWVRFGTVRQFSRQSQAVEHAFANDAVAGGAGSHAGFGG